MTKPFIEKANLDYQKWFLDNIGDPENDDGNETLFDSFKAFWNAKIREMDKKVKDLITQEILIAQKEGQPTSRLTSLAVKVGEMKK